MKYHCLSALFVSTLAIAGCTVEKTGPDSDSGSGGSSSDSNSSGGTGGSGGSGGSSSGGSSSGGASSSTSGGGEAGASAEGSGGSGGLSSSNSSGGNPGEGGAAGDSGDDSPEPTDPVQVSAGDGFTCQLLYNGDVECWGANTSGQLGNGSTMRSDTPQEVKGLSGPAKGVSAGTNYVCALLKDKTVQCWGAGSVGQLGAEIVGTSSPEPVTVTGLSGVRAITTGGTHACAVLEDSTAKCWGSNQAGMLGNGSTTSPNSSSTPLDVVGLNDVTAVVASDSHSCALQKNGAVRCWGWGNYNALGGGSNGSSGVPVLAEGITAKAVSAGTNVSCAVLLDGKVKCWGNNANGQLGTTTPDVEGSNHVTGLDSVVAVSSNTTYSCALDEDGVVSCWGYGAYGTLGDGISTSSVAPVLVVGNGFGDALQITTALGRACVLRSGWNVQCWGDR